MRGSVREGRHGACGLICGGRCGCSTVFGLARSQTLHGQMPDRSRVRVWLHWQMSDRIGLRLDLGVCWGAGDDGSIGEVRKNCAGGRVGLRAKREEEQQILI
jgi:hypothetical protein